MKCKGHLRDGWIRWTTNAAARQIKFLIFGGRCNVARCNHGRLWRCQNGDIVILLMDIGTRTNGFDATLETSIVPIIRCIRYTQIVHAATRLKVDSANSKKRTKKSVKFRTYLCIALTLSTHRHSSSSWRDYWLSIRWHAWLANSLHWIILLSVSILSSINKINSIYRLSCSQLQRPMDGSVDNHRQGKYE